jgi:carbamoyl-phosphate synthase small subunit
MMRTTATLVLEDGTTLHGAAFGAEADAVFELVFNTSMSGYQEILTDPSYRGQGVLFTNPQIGNTGINLQDDESEKPQVSALVVRALSPIVSNWRASLSLSEWLSGFQVPGIAEVDTRFLTHKIRDGGTVKAALTTRGTSPDKLLEMTQAWPGLDGVDTVQAVSCRETYTWHPDASQSAWVGMARAGNPNTSQHIVAYDYGLKRNILRHLSAGGFRVSVVPARTSAAEALALHPDGIFLSNGPGDPSGLPYAVKAVEELVESGLPIFGICLGHQLIGLALGGKTHRLKFGHHAGNHPVRDCQTGHVLITAQNHNYAVSLASLDPSRCDVTHLSLNDGTLEGLRLQDRPVFSVQFHPEAAPGPHDAHGLFLRFFDLIRSRR